MRTRNPRVLTAATLVWVAFLTIRSTLNAITRKMHGSRITGSFYMAFTIFPSAAARNLEAVFPGGLTPYLVAGRQHFRCSPRVAPRSHRIGLAITAETVPVWSAREISHQSRLMLSAILMISSVTGLWSSATISSMLETNCSILMRLLRLQWGLTFLPIPGLHERISFGAPERGE